jgi:tryptophan synthase beta chain
MDDSKTKYILDEKDMATAWYNIQADLPEPLPPLLHPGTKEPTILPPPLFVEELNKQEFSKERWIDIPEEVQSILRQWRPSSPAGSHKPNTAIAQAYYNKKAGVKRIATETGAGQWGSALAMACMYFGLECKVYMVRISYQQKPYRRNLMEVWGAKCVASPSPDTQIGKKFYDENPNHPGSLGMAISEAVEDAATHEDTRYSLGSVLNHVLMHQTVIGLETKKMMEKIGVYPDILVGCVGGGSNFAGMFLPFMKDKISGKKKNLKVICVEPTGSPSITRGLLAYDYGDVAGMAPIAFMHTLGHAFIPAPLHAGGLRYHGMAPIVSHLVKLGLVEAKAVPQLATFEAGIQFARTEGYISAPETNHAIRVTIDEALKCREEGKSKVIVLTHSGHGHFDMGAYDAYLSGKLEDFEYPEAKIKEALTELPVIPNKK